MFIKNKTAQPGFNFIEMMIVVTIMALFMALVGPRLMGLLGRGNETATKSILRTVAAAIDEYKIDTGQYPSKLEDLIKKPEGISGWRDAYVGSEKSANPEVPKDAWGQELRYEVAPRGSKPPYKLWSLNDPNKEADPIYAQ
jgi:general secretion pathway protein G